MDRSIRDDERPELEPPILQGLAQVVPQVDPPPELRARVLSIASRTPAGRLSSSPRPVAWWLATAASLALAAGLDIYTAQLRSRITGLESELRDTRARADAAQQQMVDAQRTAAGAQSAVAVLTAPDVARVDLAGQHRVAEGVGPRILEPLARHGVQRLEPAAASCRADVSAVGGDRSGADQRRTPDAGRSRQRERNVQHAAGHSAAGCDGGHHRAGRRRAGPDRRKISGVGARFRITWPWNDVHQSLADSELEAGDTG